MSENNVTPAGHLRVARFFTTSVVKAFSQIYTSYKNLYTRNNTSYKHSNNFYTPFDLKLVFDTILSR